MQCRALWWPLQCLSIMSMTIKDIDDYHIGVNSHGHLPSAQTLISMVSVCDSHTHNHSMEYDCDQSMWSQVNFQHGDALSSIIGAFWRVPLIWKWKTPPPDNVLGLERAKSLPCRGWSNTRKIILFRGIDFYSAEKKSRIFFCKEKISRKIFLTETKY